MLREIFKAVLADFCTETGWAHYSVVWLVKRTCHPQSLQLCSRLVCELRQCQWATPSWLWGISLNKDVLCALTCCLEKQTTCMQIPHAPSITSNGLGKRSNKICRRTQGIKQQLLRIAMLKNNLQGWAVQQNQMQWICTYYIKPNSG